MNISTWALRAGVPQFSFMTMVCLAVIWILSVTYSTILSRLPLSEEDNVKREELIKCKKNILYVITMILCSLLIIYPEPTLSTVIQILCIYVFAISSSIDYVTHHVYNYEVILGLFLALLHLMVSYNEMLLAETLIYVIGMMVMHVLFKCVAKNKFGFGDILMCYVTCIWLRSAGMIAICIALTLSYIIGRRMIKVEKEHFRGVPFVPCLLFALPFVLLTEIAGRIFV